MDHVKVLVLHQTHQTTIVPKVNQRVNTISHRHIDDHDPCGPQFIHKGCVTLGALSNPRTGHSYLQTGLPHVTAQIQDVPSNTGSGRFDDVQNLQFS